MKSQTIDISPELLKNPDIAREAILKLIKAREELDDFIDTLELLSDPKFKKRMDEALKQVEAGKILDFKNIDDFRKMIEE